MPFLIQDMLFAPRVLSAESTHYGMIELGGIIFVITMQLLDGAVSPFDLRHRFKIGKNGGKRRKLRVRDDLGWTTKFSVPGLWQNSNNQNRAYSAAKFSPNNARAS